MEWYRRNTLYWQIQYQRTVGNGVIPCQMGPMIWTRMDKTWSTSPATSAEKTQSDRDSSPDRACLPTPFRCRNRSHFVTLLSAGE